MLVYRKMCADLPEKVCWFTGKSVLVYRKMCAGLPENVCWFTEKSVLIRGAGRRSGASAMAIKKLIWGDVVGWGFKGLGFRV